MSLVLRLQKNSALTNEEMDGNFTFLNSEIESVRNSTNLLANVTIPALQTSVFNSLAQKQPINPNLTSLAALGATPGLLSYAGGVVTPRTIQAGSSRIVITNGNGVTADPTIDVGPTVVTTTGAQTLTNKSISGTANTITNISLSTAVTGSLPIANGGTGSSTAAGARASLASLIRPITDGIVIKTGTDATTTRQIDVLGSGLTISNKDGILGNPTITLGSSFEPDANTIVLRNQDGDVKARFVTAQRFIGNLNGTATAVQNGVYTSVTYNNPGWLSGLAGSKVKDIPNTSLENSHITFNGIDVPLGGSIIFPIPEAPKYFDVFGVNQTSPTPRDFEPQTIRGFTAFSSTDFPGTQFSGMTVVGANGAYTGQLAFNWNSQDTVPAKIYFRINKSDTDVGQWSTWEQLATTAYTTTQIEAVTTTVATKVNRSGDTMGGPLTLSRLPIQNFEAAPKLYVDNAIANNRILAVSGASYTVSYTNIVGSFSDANYFDVFPPAGRTMASIIAFIPSIHVIHFAGGVDGNDSIRCTYSYLADRIRVWVQNTEQRSTPAANWLAIWR